MKKLTRFGIIEYCKKCQNVLNDNGTTFCGLTKRMGNFEYECENFVGHKSQFQFGRNINNSNNEGREERIPYWPMAIGVLLGIMSLITFKVNTGNNVATTMSIMLNIIMRIISIGITYYISEKFNLNKWVWVILALVFSGWELVILNTYLIIYHDKVVRD